MKHSLPIYSTLLCVLCCCVSACSIGGQYGHSDKAADFETSLPNFWPPPGWSSRYVLPKGIFDSASTVGQATDIIVSALDRTGYFDKSFFATQNGGVALVTRLERIQDDGSPFPESSRWSAGQGSAWDLGRMFRKMYVTERGRYRVIVFIMSDQLIVQSAKPPTSDEAKAWLKAGANALPHEVAQRPLGNANCTALIYEFESTGAAVSLVPDNAAIPAGRQLEKAGILASLRQAR